MSTSADDYRYCVHCAADCYVAEPDHGPGCPSVTGLWPVTERELQPAGMVCMDCGSEFKAGDFSALRPADQGNVFEVVCLGCRVLNPEVVA